MDDIQVVVFDDNKPRRELLQLLINSKESYQCIGAYEDCRMIVKKIASNIPDVILMDIDMPHVNGIEGLKLVKQHFPEVKILMQTVFEDEEKIFQAIMNGANGYILKKASPQKILDAITDVVQGGAPMTPTVAQQVLNLFQTKFGSSNQKMQFNLTNREHEILKLLVNGYSYKMICKELNLTYATVNSHISHLYEKLHVSSGAQAVAKALENNLL
ncbi:MAG: response regulator transcription factor [Chitinophagaceae bacterium]|nr:response regulator transcription factor [Chitinophagaceae bacterium]